MFETGLILIWFLWNVKTTHPLFEKSRGCRLRWCDQLSNITSFTSWVGKAHKQNEGGCQWHLCMLTSDLTVRMLIYIVRGHICCPLPHLCTPGRTCSQTRLSSAVYDICRLQTTDCRLQTADSADCRL